MLNLSVQPLKTFTAELVVLRPSAAVKCCWLTPQFAGCNCGPELAPAAQPSAVHASSLGLGLTVVMAGLFLSASVASLALSVTLVAEDEDAACAGTDTAAAALSAPAAGAIVTKGSASAGESWLLLVTAASGGGVRSA